MKKVKETKRRGSAITLDRNQSRLCYPKRGKSGRKAKHLSNFLLLLLYRFLYFIFWGNSNNM